ncbi:MAG: hypothetical protein WBL63_09305 [Candidatus Acidiferrum sp.]
MLVIFGITTAISFVIKSLLDYPAFSASAGAMSPALYQSSKSGTNS